MKIYSLLCRLFVGFMKRRFAYIAFAIVAAVVVFTESRKPLYNWDMIPYMGVALEYTVPDLQVVHDSVYHTLQREVSPEVYADLNSHIEDRYDCLVSVRAFSWELNFFRTKPLYTIAVSLLFHLGAGLVEATLLPSLFACWLMLILAYRWLSVSLWPATAFFCALLIALLPVFKEFIALSTPDALSALLLLIALYLIATDNPRRLLLALVLALSVFTRIDNMVFTAVISYFVFMRGVRHRALITILLLAIAIAAIILVPVLWGNKPDWFMQFAFLYSPQHYVQHWRDLFYTAHTDLRYVLFFAAVVFLILRGTARSRLVSVIIFSTVVMHVFLFPSLQERFFGAFEIAIMILLLLHVATRSMSFLSAPRRDQIQKKA